MEVFLPGMCHEDRGMKTGLFVHSQSIGHAVFGTSRLDDGCVDVMEGHVVLVLLTPEHSGFGFNVHQLLQRDGPPFHWATFRSTPKLAVLTQESACGRRVILLRIKRAPPQELVVARHIKAPCSVLHKDALGSPMTASLAKSSRCP